MQTSPRAGNSRNQNVRCTPWGEKKHLRLREPRSYVGKGARGGKATEAWGPAQWPRASAQTQCQPADTGTVPCVESDFWDKRNQTEIDGCWAAAVKHEKGKSEERNSLDSETLSKKIPLGKLI